METAQAHLRALYDNAIANRALRALLQPSLEHIWLDLQHAARDKQTELRVAFLDPRKRSLAYTLEELEQGLHQAMRSMDLRCEKTEEVKEAWLYHLDQGEIVKSAPVPVKDSVVFCISGWAAKLPWASAF